MKKKLLILITITLLLTTPASAQVSESAQNPPEREAVENELSLRVDAIRDRRRAYTSLTDLHGLDILTPASAELERAYRELTHLKRQASVGLLFEMEQTILSGPERILLRAEELNLFVETEDEVFLRGPVSEEAGQVNYIAFGIILLALCIAGFFVSNHLHKRRRKGREHVLNNNLAAARQRI